MCYGPEFISKTLLAAHSIAVARDAWIGRDYPPVLWLVPTTTIRRQTVDALNNPRHPYRQALAAVFGEPVRVFDIADFTRLTTADLSRHLCVFVATIQTLRVENTEGRKVYPHQAPKIALRTHASSYHPGDLR